MRRKTEVSEDEQQVCGIQRGAPAPDAQRGAVSE